MPVNPASHLPVSRAAPMNSNSFSAVGGQAIATYPCYQPVLEAKRCSRYIQFGSLETSGGCKRKGGTHYCNNFHESGTHKVIQARVKAPEKYQNCVAHNDLVKCLTCPGRSGANFCNNYPQDDLTLKLRQRKWI